MNSRTRVQFRDMICKGVDHHHLRAMLRLRTTDDGKDIERSAEFWFAAAPLLWQSLPICPMCGAIAEEAATYDPSTAAIPESERMEVWISPDGKTVAVPGVKGKVMPDRYAVRGYRKLEAHSMRDIDRIESIRAAQTGNEVFSELNFDAERRKWHEDAPYDADSMTSII